MKLELEKLKKNDENQHLSFITDIDLIECLKWLFDAASKIKSDYKEESLYSNVIDPISTLMSLSAFNLTYDAWKKAEIGRQMQHSLSGKIGTFHQKLLGKMEGWIDLGVGNGADLVNHDRKIIAEIKNKYNTAKGDTRHNIYDNLFDDVMNNNSQYKNYTAYFVEIIQKRPIRYNKEFVPSNNKTSQRKEAKKNIRMIDGYSFYSLVTETEDALEQLYQIFPKVIDKEIINTSNRDNINISDYKTELVSLFNRAYKPKTKKKASNDQLSLFKKV